MARRCARSPEFRRDPHAWVKLWKHHAAQPEADEINASPASSTSRGSTLRRQDLVRVVLPEGAPDPARGARRLPRRDRLIEAADWVVWQLTGRETRNSCTAGYKALWSKRDGFPDRDYFAALDPRIREVVDEKLSRDIVADRRSRRRAQPAGRAWTGLRAGHAGRHRQRGCARLGARLRPSPARPDGRRDGHQHLPSRPRRDRALVEGMCGVVEDGILPGQFGFEAGQSAVGDIFAWFVDNAVPGRYEADASAAGVDVQSVLEREAARLEPGESGLVALDWWNGNRSILVDGDLTGVLVGATLATGPAETYRALIEATAFGTRMIIDAFDDGGVAVNEVVACGGLPSRNRLLMQIYADVTDRVFRVAGSTQTPALGAAMFGTVAAGAAGGGYDSIIEATARMARLETNRTSPTPPGIACTTTCSGSTGRCTTTSGVAPTTC